MPKAKTKLPTVEEVSIELGYPSVFDLQDAMRSMGINPGQPGYDRETIDRIPPFSHSVAPQLEAAQSEEESKEVKVETAIIAKNLGLTPEALDRILGDRGLPSGQLTLSQVHALCSQVQDIAWEKRIELATLINNKSALMREQQLLLAQDVGYWEEKQVINARRDGQNRARQEELLDRERELTDWQKRSIESTAAAGKGLSSIETQISQIEEVASPQTAVALWTGG